MVGDGPMATFPRYLHTVLDTTDPRGLAEFYRELLGLEYRDGDEPPTNGSPDDADWLRAHDSSWALLRALRSPERSHLAWLLYAVLALAFAYTHNIALLSVAAQALFAGGYLMMQVRGRFAEQLVQQTFRRVAEGFCLENKRCHTCAYHQGK